MCDKLSYVIHILIIVESCEAPSAVIVLIDPYSPASLAYLMTATRTTLPSEEGRGREETYVGGVSSLLPITTDTPLLIVYNFRWRA